MSSTRTLGTAAAALLVAAIVSNGAAAETFDPAITRDVGVVELITHDDDGKLRETKVWVVLIDGEAFLRTNASKWLANLRRDPAARLRVEDEEYPVVAEVLSDPAWIPKVDAASAEKYGWQEKSIHLFRMKDPTIIRLNPAS
jgi:hypothetical protein